MAYINGNAYAGHDVQINILGVDLIAVEALNYVENVTGNRLQHGLGRVAVSNSNGRREFSGNLVLSFEELQAIRQAASNAGIFGGDITAIQPFNIIVTYISPGRTPVVHELLDCLFINNGSNIASADNALYFDLQFVYRLANYTA